MRTRTIARSKHIEWTTFLTAKAPRARREKTMNKTKDEIEQIAEQVVDAVQAQGQWVMSGCVSFLALLAPSW